MQTFQASDPATKKPTSTIDAAPHYSALKNSSVSPCHDDIRLSNPWSGSHTTFSPSMCIGLAVSVATKNCRIYSSQRFDIRSTFPLRGVDTHSSAYSDCLFFVRDAMQVDLGGKRKNSNINSNHPRCGRLLELSGARVWW